MVKQGWRVSLTMKDASSKPSSKSGGCDACPDDDDDDDEDDDRYQSRVYIDPDPPLLMRLPAQNHDTDKHTSSVMVWVACIILAIVVIAFIVAAVWSGSWKYQCEEPSPPPPCKPVDKCCCKKKRRSKCCISPGRRRPCSDSDDDAGSGKVKISVTVDR